jgi:predicted site-specific integrase-resolvase
VAISARVWAAEHRPHLERQAQQVVNEIGSGVNESRPNFLKLLADPGITVVVVERQERATR